MGDYFIGSDGELYHWGWKKKDAKYIKRERKNGKWVYTYPEENKSGKTPVVTAKKNTGKLTTLNVANMLQKARDAANVKSGKKETDNKKASSEYEAELAYNSKKNDYGDAKKKTSETKKPEDKKKESNWLEKAKEKLDNVGDWASDKLKDVGDTIEDIAEGAGDFIDDAKDWIGDRADDLYDATIGEVKDVMGYDERDAMYKAKDAFENAENKVDHTMDRFLRRLNPDISAESVASTAKVLEYDCRDWAKAEAEYAYTKAKYDASLIGRIDNWISGNQTDPPSDLEIEKLRLAANAMQYDPIIEKREGEYLANSLLDEVVTNYVVYNKRVTHDDPVWSSNDAVRDNAISAYYELITHMQYRDETIYGYDMGYIEIERLERMRKSLENRYKQDG